MNRCRYDCGGKPPAWAIQAGNCAGEVWNGLEQFEIGLAPFLMWQRKKPRIINRGKLSQPTNFILITVTIMYRMIIY